MRGRTCLPEDAKLPGAEENCHHLGVVAHTFQNNHPAKSEGIYFTQIDQYIVPVLTFLSL